MKTQIRMYTYDEMVTNLHEKSDPTLPERIEFFNFLDFMGTIRNPDMAVYITAELDGTIIGVGKIVGSIWGDDIRAISYISVDPNHTGKGLASQISEKIFLFAKHHSHTLRSTDYTSIGWQKLRPIFLRLADKYKVNFIDGKLGY